MSNLDVSPKRRQRLPRAALVLLLMGTSFGLGGVVTAIVAARFVVPIAAAGMVIGLAGLASASITEIVNVLHTGTSQARFEALTQLKNHWVDQPQAKIHPQLAEWLLPALRRCETDDDLRVVVLAAEVIGLVENSQEAA